MSTPALNRPVILAFSGHDPTGAAGLQADIESIAQNHGHCISIITTLTAQNTCSFNVMLPQNPLELKRQAELLLADIPIHACKIGLVGSPDLIDVIADTVSGLGDIPIVVDPILRAGTGTTLSTSSTIHKMLTRLFPLASLITPNTDEAARLSGETDMDAAAARLLDYGCRHVLITGSTHKPQSIVNVLYSLDQEPLTLEWERLPGTYHGSGCTLSAAIAARLAQGEDVATAVEKAQRFTWHSLKHGEKLGKAQWHPNRFFHEH